MPLRRHPILFAPVLIGLFSIGCAHFEREEFCRWHELRPPPDKAAVERFRAQFPTTPVTTTQPNGWNKIEVGMTRGMVRTLAGGRLRDPRRGDVAKLVQEPPAFQKWDVRLYFRESPGDETPAAEDDVLEAIIIRCVSDRPIQSTDWL